MIQIVRKELRAWMKKPIFYVALGSALVCIAAFVWFFRGGKQILKIQHSFYSIFYIIGWCLIVFVPLFVSRIFVSELKTKTIGLLLSKPLSVTDFILGKMLATFVLILLFLLLASSNFITVHLCLEGTVREAFNGSVLLLLMSLAYVSVCMAISCFTESYFKAWGYSILAILFIHLGFDFLASFSVGELQEFLYYFGVSHRLERGILRGLELDSVVYLLSVVIIGFVVTHLKLNNIDK